MLLLSLNPFVVWCNVTWFCFSMCWQYFLSHDKCNTNEQIGEISQCDGTVVLGVAPNSHAERAGLRCGDILCYPSTDGTVPLPFSALGSATSKEPGMPLSMDVIRRQRPERTSWFNGRSRVSVSKILWFIPFHNSINAADWLCLRWKVLKL